jgi:hypothetical protein
MCGWHDSKTAFIFMRLRRYAFRNVVPQPHTVQAMSIDDYYRIDYFNLNIVTNAAVPAAPRRV